MVARRLTSCLYHWLCGPDFGAAESSGLGLSVTVLVCGDARTSFVKPRVLDLTITLT